MADMGWTQYDESQERSSVMACVTTAERHGATAKDAEDCDDGSVGCPDCPFKSQEVAHSSPTLR